MAQSDLLPENIALSAWTVVPGGSLTVSWSLVNQGSAAANSTSTTEVRITSSSTSYGNPSNNVGSVSAAALAGNSSVLESATVTVPTTPGTYYAWVIADNNGNVTNQSNIGNDEQSSVAFTVAPAPSLTSLSPTSLPPDGNDHLMILFGNNFQSGDTLVFTDPQGRTYNSVPSKLTFISNSVIEYALNDGSDAGIWSVQVYSPDGALHSSSSSFTVATPLLTPSLSFVAPSSLPSDGSDHTIELLGSNFQSGDTLVFTDPQGRTYNSVPGKLSFVSSGEIDYNLNDGSDPGTWSVQVYSPDGARHSGTSNFTVAVLPPPSLTSVSPGSLPSDANDHAIRLLGSDFQSGDTLVFTDPQGRTYNSVSGKLSYVSANEIDYSLNDGGDAGTWTVQVYSPDGTQHSGSSAFTVSAIATVSTAGSNISFANTYGTGVSAAYKSSIVAAEKDIESHWTAPNPITISLDFLAATLRPDDRRRKQLLLCFRQLCGFEKQASVLRHPAGQQSDPGLDQQHDRLELAGSLRADVGTEHDDPDVRRGRYLEQQRRLDLWPGCRQRPGARDHRRRNGTRRRPRRPEQPLEHDGSVPLQFRGVSRLSGWPG